MSNIINSGSHPAAASPANAFDKAVADNGQELAALTVDVDDIPAAGGTPKRRELGGGRNDAYDKAVEDFGDQG